LENASSQKDHADKEPHSRACLGSFFEGGKNPMRWPRTASAKGRSRRRWQRHPRGRAAAGPGVVSGLDRCPDCNTMKSID